MASCFLILFLIVVFSQAQLHCNVSPFNFSLTSTFHTRMGDNTENFLEKIIMYANYTDNRIYSAKFLDGTLALNIANFKFCQFHGNVGRGYLLTLAGNVITVNETGESSFLHIGPKYDKADPKKVHQFAFLNSTNSPGYGVFILGDKRVGCVSSILPNTTDQYFPAHWYPQCGEGDPRFNYHWMMPRTENSTTTITNYNTKVLDLFLTTSLDKDLILATPTFHVLDRWRWWNIPMTAVGNAEATYIVDVITMKVITANIEKGKVTLEKWWPPETIKSIYEGNTRWVYRRLDVPIENSNRWSQMQIVRHTEDYLCWFNTAKFIDGNLTLVNCNDRNSSESKLFQITKAAINNKPARPIRPVWIRHASSPNLYWQANSSGFLVAHQLDQNVLDFSFSWGDWSEQLGYINLYQRVRDVRPDSKFEYVVYNNDDTDKGSSSGWKIEKNGNGVIYWEEEFINKGCVAVGQNLELVLTTNVTFCARWIIEPVTVCGYNIQSFQRAGMDTPQWMVVQPDGKVLLANQSGHSIWCWTPLMSVRYEKKFFFRVKDTNLYLNYNGVLKPWSVDRSEEFEFTLNHSLPWNGTKYFSFEHEGKCLVNPGKDPNLLELGNCGSELNTLFAPIPGFIQNGFRSLIKKKNENTVPL